MLCMHAVVFYREENVPGERKKVITVLRNMLPFRSIVKELWNGAFDVVKFSCILHVIENYLITPIKVSLIPPSTYCKFFFHD